MDVKKTEIDKLKEYKEKLSKLNEMERKKRDLYLKKISTGDIHGPEIGLPNLDKPWLQFYSDDDIMEEFPKQSIYDFLLDKNKENMDNYLLEYFGKKIKTKDVIKNSEIVARRLVNDYGIKKGDIVSLCVPTIPETYYLFLAINSIGAVANLIDPRINLERIKECLGVDSKIIFAVDTYSEKINEATKELNVDVVSISPAESLNIIMKNAYNVKAKPVKIDRFISWKNFFGGKNQKSNLSVEKILYSENMPAAIVYTSGTTGIPKGTILTNENIISVALHQVKNVPDMKKGDKYLVIMPPFIAYGLVCGICCPMSTCQKMILIPKFEPRNFPELVAKHKPNHILGLPSFFESLVKSHLFNDMDLSFIKYCIVGGDKMTVESEKKINDFFKKHNVKNKIVKGYGMTELSSAAITTHDDSSNKLGSAGIPYTKNNVKILNTENGKEVGFNELGEIYISSPSMMYGYKDKAEEEQKVIVKDEFGQNWVKTGDIGMVDELGNVTIHGRIKRMIVRPDGHNVFPSAIEEVLITHYAVNSVVVIGVKSKEYDNGYIPTAIIVLDEKYLNIKEEIIEELKCLSLEKLPPRDVALDYRVRESIPYTSVGKIDVKLLEEEYAENERIIRNAK